MKSIRNDIGAALMLFLILFAIYRVVQMQKNPVSPSQVDNISAFKIKWTGMVKSLGGRAAYDKFAAEYRDSLQSHSYAHVFGMLLYELNGIKGITECDDKLRYGCPHGFIAAAIQKEGLRVIPSLIVLCEKKFSDIYMCAHAVGHGLLAYLGEDHLTDTIAQCSLLLSPRKEQCYDGLFMEYFDHMVTDPFGDMNMKRAIDSKNPFQLCLSIDSAAQPACIFHVVRTWLMSDAITVSQIGKQCALWTARRSRERCYSAIGISLFYSRSRTKDQALSDCMTLSTKDGQLLCATVVRESGCEANIGKQSTMSAMQVSELCREMEE